MQQKRSYTFLVFAFGFLLLAFPLFSRGMFMDGTIYAAVASNLSQGNGSLWAMKFSETLMNPFYEHPPLAIWLESIFHKLLGDSFLSERIYSLFMWGLNGWLIVKIWEVLKPKSVLKWVPLLLWFMIPIVIWSFSNNMLENTMGVFVSGSVLFFLKGIITKKHYWNLLSGVMLTLAFLSKGFVGLFPFALPVLYLLFFAAERRFLDHLISGLLMVVGFFGLLSPFLFNATSMEFLQTYFDHQVKNSVENIQTVSHRFKILEYFFLQVFLPLALSVAIFFTAKNKEKLDSSNRKWAGFFIVLALCGVLPIMISLKQRDFYILTVYPFVALAIVMYFENAFIRLNERLCLKLPDPKKWTVIIFVLAVVLSISATNFYKRDKELVKGSVALAESKYQGLSVDCSNNIRYGWGAMAYLSRYAKISVWRGAASDVKIMFSNEKTEKEEEVYAGFKLVQSDN